MGSPDLPLPGWALTANRTSGPIFILVIAWGSQPTTRTWNLCQAETADLLGYGKGGPTWQWTPSGQRPHRWSIWLTKVEPDASWLG